MSPRFTREVLDDMPEGIGKEYTRLELDIGDLIERVRVIRNRPDYRPMSEIEEDDMANTIGALDIALDILTQP